MMASGSFIPFSQYTHDLTRAMSGLCQIYPSRHITVNINESIEDIRNYIPTINSKIDEIRNESTVASDIDYGKIRSALYESIYPKIAITDSTSAPEAPAMGEINFISHELQGGWMYNDIYVHVTPEEGKQTVIMQPSGFEANPKRTGLDYDITTKEYRTSPSSRDKLTFNAIIIYYNLHRIDPTSKTADTEPVVIDMPMGIYVLNEPATVQLDNENIFNQGAAWSTRIVSRIATKGTISAVSSDRNQEYATLARVLSEFGDVASVMDDIIHRRNVSSRNRSYIGADSLAMSPEDIKSYLEEFRKLRAVNVPYIKDNHWFVNGRDLGPVSGEVDWGWVFSEWLRSLPKDDELRKQLKGDKGDKGDPGTPGPQGIQGPKGDPGTPGINGVSIKGDPGHTPTVVLGDDFYLNIDGVKQPYCLKGPKGDSGKKGDQGDPGDTPSVTLDKDGYLIINGIKQPYCLKGRDGVDGINGKNGKDGDSGKKGDKGDPGPKGDKGDKGDPGKDAETVFYGFTNSALTADDKPFVPTSQGESIAGIKPNGEPSLQLSKMPADKTHQYIWKYNGEKWVIIDWKYINPNDVIQSALQNTVIETSLSYGCIKIQTDAIWAVFKNTLGGTDWSFDGEVPETWSWKEPYHAKQGILCKPAKICDTSYSMVDNNATYVITLERWDQKSKRLMLTTSQAFEQIFDAIESGEAGKFNWKQLKEYFNADLPAIPFVIQFANGIFTIQDCHNLSFDESGRLTSIYLYGSLTIWNSGQSYMQTGHNNIEKYAVDMPLCVKLSRDDCSTSKGSASDVNALIRELPRSA